MTDVVASMATTPITIKRMIGAIPFSLLFSSLGII